MKMKKMPHHFVLIAFCMAIFMISHAQDKIIRGTVLDNASNPIQGASVNVKGTTTTTATNETGVFSIVMPTGKKALLISFVGFLTKEVVANGGDLTIQLSPSADSLSNVVITALGFEAKKDRLGYATNKITGEKVAISGEANLIDALGGKSSGVRISRTSGDPGAASQILIRGQSTITRGTEPLIVLDGIPITGDSRGESSGNTTQQSRLNDINADDIANIQILKGASAAALWGTRAANGVVVITTKKGGGNRTNISFKSTYSIDEVSAFYDLQSAYGQGTNGAWQANGIRTWGDKIADRAGGADDVNVNGASFLGNTGQIIYPITAKKSKDTYLDKNRDAVLGNGHYFDNSLSVSGGDAKGNYFISINDLNQQGIIKNSSSYRRTGLRINAGKTMNNWLSFSNSASYTLINSDRIQTGVNNAGFMIGLLRTPADFDNSDYIGSYAATAGGAQIPDRQRSYRNYLGASANPGFNNPLWVTNELENSSKVNRFINSAEMKIKPASWFSVTTRAGIDYFTDQQLNYFPFYSANANTGQYNRSEFSQMQFNLDVIGQAETDITKNISANFLAGFNYNSLNNSNLAGQSLNFILPAGPRDFDNATPSNITVTDNFLTRKSNAGYASAGFAFYDQLFVNATGRVEAASTFGEEAANTFFYPSADIAWQFTKLKALDNSSFLSFGKMRVAFGIVGVQPLAYQTQTNFTARTFQDGFGGALDPALYGTGSILESTQKGNPFLKPERKQEFEIGTDLRLFKDKISLSVTYYQNETKDALISIPQASSTGFETLYANAGTIENKGWELDLGYTPISTKDWTVGFNVNWTRNRNLVTNLNGAGSINLGGTAGISSRAVEGYALGVLYSTPWVRDSKGDLSLDANGFPVPDIVAAPLGDPNPDWRAGFSMNIRYKKFQLSATMEHSQGGIVANGTEAVILDYGTSATTGIESTYPAALKAYNGATIPANTPFRGNIHDFGAGPVALNQAWYTGPGGFFGNVGEQFLEDATWTRFRDLTLSYTITSQKLKKSAGLNSIIIEAGGRNLLLFSEVNGYDPDSNVAGSSSARGVVYFVNPPTRSYLFTLKLNF